MGEALGHAGVSVEGAGPGSLAAPESPISSSRTRGRRAALEAAGIRVIAERDVIVQRLKQDVPGQLGYSPADGRGRVNIESPVQRSRPPNDSRCR